MEASTVKPLSYSSSELTANAKMCHMLKATKRRLTILHISCSCFTSPDMIKNAGFDEKKKGKNIDTI